MNYDLAKELKDAGFPHRWCYEMENGIENESCKNPAWHCFPTLEELIEACGDRELRLSKVEGVTNGNYEWRAIVPYQEPTGYGSTPTEAVAVLWLALNRKEA